MKKTKKLIPAVIILLASIVTMSTATFAWFTISRQVTAQGMNVTVTAPTNLLIAPVADDSSIGDYAAAASHSTDKADVRLVPASTVNGTNFFVVDIENTADDGVGSNGSLTGANVTAGVEGNAYVDFKYSIKVMGDVSVGSPIDVVIKEIKITDKSLFGGKSIQPVRVAVLVGSDVVAMIAPEGADHQVSDTAVNGFTDAGTNGYGVATTDTVTYATKGGTDKYYKGINVASLDEGVIAQFTVADTPVAVTIRVWYEGEDKDCTNTKGANTNFDVEVVLADPDSIE